MPFRQRGRVLLVVAFGSGSWYERVRFYEIGDGGPRLAPVPLEVRDLLDSSLQVRVLRDRRGEHWIYGQRLGSPEPDFFVVSSGRGALREVSATFQVLRSLGLPQDDGRRSRLSV